MSKIERTTAEAIVYIKRTLVIGVFVRPEVSILASGVGSGVSFRFRLRGQLAKWV